MRGCRYPILPTISTTELSGQRNLLDVVGLEGQVRSGSTQLSRRPTEKVSRIPAFRAASELGSDSSLEPGTNRCWPTDITAVTPAQQRRYGGDPTHTPGRCSQSLPEVRGASPHSATRRDGPGHRHQSHCKNYSEPPTIPVIPHRPCLLTSTIDAP